MIRVIVGNELKRLFRTPLSWTLMAVVVLLLAYLYLAFLENFTTQIQPGNAGSDSPVGTTRAIVTPLFTWAAMILLAMLPLVTMRSLSLEYQKKTWQLLAAAPIKPWQITLGKYLASLAFLNIIAALFITMPLSLLFGSSIDLGVLLSNAIGLWLLLAAATAAGVYFSSLTAEAGNAAMATFGLLLFLYVLQVSANMPGKVSPLFYYLSPWTHYTAFLTARFSSLHAAYFALFTVLFLWLTHRQIRHKLDLQQPRSFASVVQLIIGIVIIIGIAWLSIRFTWHADLSHHKQNTLPNEAISLLRQMDHPLNIKAVVENKPEIHRRVEFALTPFLQHKKDINISYEDSRLQRLEGSDSLQQGGQLVFNYNGRQEILNNLDQKQIINSLYQLTQGQQPWLVFTEGHGELNISDTENQGASRLVAQLQQQGFKTFSHNLVRHPTIPDNTAVLIIAGADQAFLPAEVSIISDFISNGGNLLWLHDHDELGGLEELLDRLPINFLPGMVVNADQSVQALIGSKHPAVFPVTDYHSHGLTQQLDGQTILAFARALEATGQPPWQVRSFLQSPSACWNETGSLQGHIKPDTDAEQSGPFSIGLSLERQLGEQMQRIIILGDKDFATNEIIGYGVNNELVLRIFHWLNQPQTDFHLPPGSTPDTSLDFTATQLNLIAVLFLFLAPSLFLLLALRQWRRYRVRQ